MWILFLLLLFIIIFVVQKILFGQLNNANSIIKCYSVALEKLLENAHLGEGDPKERFKEAIDNMGLVIATSYLFNIPASTPAREHIRENFEKYFSNCRGVSDENVSRVIFLIFWYNYSDASFSYDFEKKYKLNDLENYNEFYRLRDQVHKIING